MIVTLLIQVSRLGVAHRDDHLRVLVDAALIIVLNDVLEQKLRGDLDPILPARVALPVYFIVLSFYFRVSLLQLLASKPVLFLYLKLDQRPPELEERRLVALLVGAYDLDGALDLY